MTATRKTRGISVHKIKQPLTLYKLRLSKCLEGDKINFFKMALQLYSKKDPT